MDGILWKSTVKPIISLYYYENKRKLKIERTNSTQMNRKHEICNLR